ncbi:hypothetical protein ACLB2K_074536 [Fragaria x ananassa]
MHSDHEVLSFTPATQSAIDALEKVRLDAAKVAETPMCAICQEFAVEDVTRTPCLHYYHGDCIVSDCMLVIYVPCADTRCRSTAGHHRSP